MLDSEEFIQKLAGSDDSELSDTDKNSDTDFNEQEHVLLLDIGDYNDMGDGTQVTDSSFLW
jgi:hypothetical protein